MKALVAAAVVLALAACGGSRKQQASRPVTVSDSDYGRLAAGQTDIVDQARTDLARARDELARTKLRQTEAAQATSLAQADAGVAQAELQRAAARTKMAQESNDPTELSLASNMTESAKLREATAQARLDYAQKLQSARAAEVAAAEKNVAYQEMRVEQSKLQALQMAQVPAAAKYDGAQLDGRLAASRKELDEASAAARAAVQQSMTAEQRWLELNRQLQARSGGPAPRG